MTVRPGELTKMVNAAVVYASRGVAVFPIWGIKDGRCGCGAQDCGNAGKHPIASLAPRGFQDATTDQATIRRWWAQHPDANIGVPTDWCVVLDI